MIFHSSGKIHKTFQMQFNGAIINIFTMFITRNQKQKEHNHQVFNLFRQVIFTNTSVAELSIKHSGAVASHLKILRDFQSH